MSPYTSSLGRWWALMASSTASSCSWNSRRTESNSSSVGSYRPIQANESLPLALLERVVQLKLALAAAALVVDGAVDEHRSAILRAGAGRTPPLPRAWTPRRRKRPTRAPPAARPSSGPGGISSSRASSSPGSGARGGPSARQRSAAAITSRASSRCAAIHSSWPGRRGGHAIGAREHGDLHLHRLAAAQVVVHGARRQRALVHEEPEPQVLAGEPAHERAQALAGAQPPEHVRDDLLPHLVVPHERDLAVVAAAARGRLAHVVEQRAEAQRLRRG